MAFNNNGDVDIREWRFDDVVNEPRRMLPPIEGYQDEDLVSLEEAVKPLVGHVRHVEAKAREATEKSNESSEYGLTKDEFASIRIYTMEWDPREESLYFKFNTDLRSEDRQELKKWFPYLKLFITALVKTPSVDKGILRGVNKNLSADYQIGHTVVWWGFSSCTLTETVVTKSKNFCGTTGPRTLFKIDSFTGKDLRAYSAYPKEDEVLLIAARQFQVTSKVDEVDGLTTIHLKEIKPEYPLIHISNVKFISNTTDTSQKPYCTNKPPKSILSVSGSNYRNPNILTQIKQVQNHGNAVIEGEPIGEEDMLDLVQVIVKDKKYPKLQIHNSELTTDSISVLGRAIGKSTDLVEVDLSNNRLSSNDVSCLVTELLAQEPQTVMSYICWVIPRVTKLDTGCLQILNLSSNGIDDDGVKHLAKLLKAKKSLADLYLNDNAIGDRGVELLAETLSDPTAKLQKLYLSNNKHIKNRSANYLDEMLKVNGSLNTLWLLNCNFEDTGRQKLIERAASKKNFYLNIERFHSN